MSAESLLFPCGHHLAKAAPARAGESPQPRLAVFQIERIEDVAPRRFLPVERFALHVLHEGIVDRLPTEAASGTGPFQMLCRIHASGDLSAVGGYRVHVRDVLGKSDAAAGPFTVIREFEAVPAALYRLRPYAIDSSRRLRIATDAGGVNEPTKPYSVPPTVPAKRARDFFTQLGEALVKTPGSPRLLRAPETGADDIAPKALHLGSERLQVLLRELGIDENRAKQLEDKDETEAGRAAAEVMKSSPQNIWRVMGVLVDWLAANGFARDLILPLEVQDGARAKAILEEALKAAAASEQKPGGVEAPLDWLAIAVQATTGVTGVGEPLLATVRVAVLPGVKELGWSDVDIGFRRLLSAALVVSPNRLSLFTEDVADGRLQPLDAAGCCTIVWDGIHDRWQHQLEVVVEVLDRYAFAREFFASDETPPRVASTALNEKELGDAARSQGRERDEWIGRLLIPRLQEAPPPPAVFPLLDPQRVAFRIQHHSEWIQSHHNLLNRVRQGALELLVRFGHVLPWRERFTPLGFEFRRGSIDDPSVDRDDPPLPADPTSPDSPDGWTSATEDEVEVRPALYFLEYTMSGWYRAGHQEGARPERPTACQRLPGTIDRDRLKTARVSHTAQPERLNLEIPLLRLRDLLTEEEQGAADSHADPEVRAALDWPDLAVEYLVLERLAAADRILLTITGPVTEADAKGFTALAMQESCSVVEGSIDLVSEGDEAPSLNIELNVTDESASSRADRLWVFARRGDLNTGVPVKITTTQGGI